MIAHDLDGMVQQPLEAKLDASDHRPDLADSLPDYPRKLRVRIRAGH